MKQTTSRRGMSGAFTGAVLVSAVALALAGCGGSTSDASTATAADTAGLAQAKARAQTFSKPPTSVGVTTPVGKPIPSNKTIVLVGAGQSAGGTLYTYDGFKQAAEVLGWTVKEVQPKEPTPQELQQALTQAIQLRPDAVAISAVEQAPITAQLKQLQSMHIPVIETFSPDAPGGPVTMQLMDVAPQAALTSAVADKVLADLGHPAQIGMIGLQGYDVVQQYSKGFSKEVGKLCPSCSIKKMEVPLASLGTSDGTDIVNFLRANPGIKALFVGFDGMDSSLFSAARAAGVTLPKVYSSATLPTSIGNLASGDLTGSAPIDYYSLGWRQADAFARIFTGQTASAQKVDLQYERPTVWAKSFGNVPAVPGKGAVPTVVDDYQQEWKQLWGK